MRQIDSHTKLEIDENLMPDGIESMSAMELFGKGAWRPIVKEAVMPTSLALKCLRGWKNLFKNPTRSPVWILSDSLIEAFSTWTKEGGEFGSFQMIDPKDQYPLSLNLSLDILYLKTYSASTRTNISLNQTFNIDDDYSFDPPPSPDQMITEVVKKINQQDPNKESSLEEQIVVYAAPRFCAVEILKKMEELSKKLVINPNSKTREEGFPFKYSPKTLRAMCCGHSARLITLENNNTVDGMYLLHLAFPYEPKHGIYAAKQRVEEYNLYPEDEREYPFYSRRQALPPVSTSWIDLIAISKAARIRFAKEQTHAYALVHKTMEDLCRLHSVKRVFGEVRIGDNENLAWRAHKRLGWIMPNEDLQRKNPIRHNDNEYALIYYDIKDSN